MNYNFCFKNKKFNFCLQNFLIKYINFKNKISHNLHVLEKFNLCLCKNTYFINKLIPKKIMKKIFLKKIRKF